MTEIVPLHPFLFDHDFDAADAATMRTVPGGVAADAARAIQIEQALAGARAEGLAKAIDRASPRQVLPSIIGSPALSMR